MSRAITKNDDDQVARGGIRSRGLVAGVLLAGLCASGAEIRAAPADYLPLAAGNRWVLRSAQESQPVVLEVLEVSGDRYRLRYDNPWVPGVLEMRRSGAKHLLEALTLAGQRTAMPPGTVYFDVAGGRGHRWSNALGDLEVASRSETVPTSDGTLRDCVRIDQHEAGAAAPQRWTLCPGVGFGRFEIAGVPFVLDRSASRISGAASAAAATAPSAASGAKPRGDRILSIAITMDRSYDFVSAFRVARTAGMHEQGGLLNYDWNAIETSPGKFVDPEDGALAFANRFYPREKVASSLTLAPIQTNVMALPSDLSGLAFDSPRIAERFNAMADYVLDATRDIDLRSIAIGNEVDAYLGADAARWRQYGVFFEAARQHVRKRRPAIPVGVKITFPALVGPTRDLARDLNRAADVIMVTYYPLNDDFSVRDPSEISRDFGAMVDLYPDRPIFILEAGYPSSARLGSSPQRQADFVRAVFQAWDRHADHIKLVDFTWLHDVSPDTLRNFESYYGSSDPSFLAYLGTLGLRTNDGKDKPAFVALKEEARRRGW